MFCFDNGFYLCIEEISAMIDVVALLYKGTTPVEERSAPGIWLAMTKAQ